MTGAVESSPPPVSYLGPDAVGKERVPPSATQPPSMPLCQAPVNTMETRNTGPWSRCALSRGGWSPWAGHFLATAGWNSGLPSLPVRPPLPLARSDELEVAPRAAPGRLTGLWLCCSGGC